MKKFIRSKFINGHEYQYEITPYYDPITKKVKQHSKYLGKKKEGLIAKVRVKKAKNVLSYGEILPLLEIMRNYKLQEFFESVFGETNAKKIIVLILFKALTHLSLRDVERWYESVFVNRQFGELSLSSQSLSQLLAIIGKQRIEDKLTSHLIKTLESKRTLFYDITSISSYSGLIDILEWGYNRDALNLAQVNLSVIVDKDEGIPIAYELYPGSLSDVKTLHNTIERLKRQDIKNFLLILDRGFFSNTNVEDLLKTKADFIIALPERYKEVQKLLDSLEPHIEKTNNGHLYEDQLLFTEEVKINTGKVKLKGYAYYNPQRGQKEKENFYKRVLAVKEKLEGMPRNKLTAEVIEDKAGDIASLFEIDNKTDTTAITINEKLVAHRLRHKGMFILAYQGNYTWQECLSFYKSKQLIEMSFDILKNDLDITTPQVHSTENLRGLLFISLIALLLRMRVLKILQESGFNKTYSYERFLLELQKLKMICFDDNDIIITEITKKQNDLLNLFNIVPN